MNDFDDQWKTWDGRMILVSGKEALSALNQHLQTSGGSSITPFAIIDAMRRDEVPREVVALITKIADAKAVATEEPLDAELA